MVRLNFRLPNGKIIRPKHWMRAGAGPAPFAQLDDIAQAAADAVVSSGLMANFNEDLTFLAATAQNFETFPRNGPPFDPDEPEYPYGGITPITSQVQSVNDTVPGTVVTDGEPPQIAVVFSLRTAAEGPKGRGRSYYPPPPEANVNSDGSIQTAWIGNLYADINSVVTAILTAADPDGLLGVLSAGGAEGVEAWYEGTSSYMTALARTMRRRATR